METATLAAEQNREGLDDEILRNRIEDFCSRWAPKQAYGYENHARFSAELLNIIQIVIREAQEPILKHLVEIAKLAPAPILSYPAPNFGAGSDPDPGFYRDSGNKGGGK